MNDKNSKVIVATLAGAAAVPATGLVLNDAPVPEASAAASQDIQAVEPKRVPRFNFPVRSYNQTPDIFIQHTATERMFYIPAEQIERFRVNRQAWEKIGADTTVFTVPDTQFIEPVPPFLRLPSKTPSVLIRHMRANAAYLLSYEQLQEFDVTETNVALHPERVSFSIPFGTELVERLPAAVNAMLQSGECSACHTSAIGNVRFK